MWCRLSIVVEDTRIQAERNTIKHTYESKVLSARGGAGQRVGYTKIGPRASPNRITPRIALKK